MTLKSLFIPLTLLAAINTQSQELPSKISQALTHYVAEHPQEKVYLHTDKPYYATGDTLWFKAYATHAMSHVPASSGAVLYVEVAQEERGRTLLSKKVRLNNGTGNGHFALPDSLSEGVYQLRAYTNYMRNADEAFFFRKELKVYSTKTQRQPISESDVERFSKIAAFDFFPEGGNLISGLNNRVAFKAINAVGKGINCAGFVLSDRGDTISMIYSQHLGMGHFMIKPDRDTKYFAHIKLQDGKIERYPLPAALASGYNMVVENLNASNIKVFVKHNLPSPDRATLIVHQRGRIVYAAQVNSDQQEYLMSIPKESVPAEGIVHLTIFNGQGVPQCERIVYVAKKDHAVAEMRTSKPQYNRKEKANINIQVLDHNGQPLQGTFSVAVTDAGQVIADKEAFNIKSYLYVSADLPSTTLSGEIKGTIENPSYYFDSKNKSAGIYLDLLMMTQGWRRFLWKDVLSTEQRQQSFRPEQGITLQGKVLRMNGKNIKAPVDLILMAFGRDNQRSLFFGTTDLTGKFQFDDLDIEDSVRVLVQASKSNGARNMEVSLNEPSHPAVPVFHYPVNPMLLDRERVEQFLRRKQENEQFEKSLKLGKTQLLKEITIEEKREEADPRRSMYGTPDAKVEVDNTLCAGATSVLQLIQGRVAGVMVSYNQMDPSGGSVMIRGQQAAFLVDGMRVDDVSFLSPCDVEAIEVVRGPSLIANAPGGAISILTRRGNKDYDYSKDKAVGINITEIEGYAIPKLFYSPVYEKGYDASVIPDYRSTIYWQANVITDEQGKATISFYNSEAITEVHVALEGITNQGQPVVADITYAVKENR